MATKEQLKTWIVENQDKQGKEGKDGQDFEKVKSKYLSLRGKTSRAEADAEADVKTGDYSVGAERARTALHKVLHWVLQMKSRLVQGLCSLIASIKTSGMKLGKTLSDFRTDNPGQALALEMAGGVVIPGGILRSGCKTAIKTGSKKR